MDLITEHEARRLLSQLKAAAENNTQLGPIGQKQVVDVIRVVEKGLPVRGSRGLSSFVTKECILNAALTPLAACPPEDDREKTGEVFAAEFLFNATGPNARTFRDEMRKRMHELTTQSL